MNVLHVVPSLEGRSWTRDIEILARRLPSVGARIFCLGDAGPAAEPLLRGRTDVVLRRGGRLFDVSLLLRLRAVLREEPPDAIHAWGMASVRAIAAARFSDLSRTIVSCPLPPKARDLGLFSRWLLRQTRLVVARTQAEADALGSVGMRAASIRIVPPGAEPLPLLRRDPALPPTIQAVSRLVPHKGLRDAIWAQDILVHGFPQLHLRIVGEGPYRRTLEQFAFDLQTANVDLPGERAEPERDGTAFDFAWALSTGGFGCRGVLEAMAAGKPVVASDLRHHRELIRDGATGWLTPPGDKVGPARRIYALLHDRDPGDRVGAAARADVLQRFSAQAFAEGLYALYRGG